MIYPCFTQNGFYGDIYLHSFVRTLLLCLLVYYSIFIRNDIYLYVFHKYLGTTYRRKCVGLGVGWKHIFKSKRIEDAGLIMPRRSISHDAIKLSFQHRPQ